MVCAVGCIGTMPKDAYFARTLAPRAAFDLHCPEKQITFANLGPSSDIYGYDGDRLVGVAGAAKTMGAEGCGRRAVYVQAPNLEWLMNSASDSEKAADSGVSPTSEPKKK